MYEIEADGSALNNQITLASDNYDLYFPSLATDKQNNLLLSFSISSNENGPADLYPSIGYTGRRATDTPNTIDPVVVIIKAGLTSIEQTNPNRWGDYSGTVVDPTNQENIWMFNQYVIANDQIGTWIAATGYFFYKTYIPMIRK